MPKILLFLIMPPAGFLLKTLTIHMTRTVDAVQQLHAVQVGDILASYSTIVFLLVCACVTTFDKKPASMRNYKYLVFELGER